MRPATIMHEGAFVYELQAEVGEFAGEADVLIHVGVDVRIERHTDGNFAAQSEVGGGKWFAVRDRCRA